MESVDRLRTAVEALIANKQSQAPTGAPEQVAQVTETLAQVVSELDEITDRINSVLPLEDQGIINSMAATDEIVNPSNQEAQTLQHVEGGTGTLDTPEKIPS